MRPIRRRLVERIVISTNAALILLIPGACFGLNADGPLRDFLVDASLGEFDSSEASQFVSLLNQFQLSGYALEFSDGSSVGLDQNPEALDNALQQKEQGNADLTTFSGPSGKFTFADSEQATSTCSTGGGTTGTVLDSLLNCVGAAIQPANALQAASAAVSQVNTIDLLILRPTSQFMVTIRGFVAPRFQNRSNLTTSTPGSNSDPNNDRGATGGGSGDEAGLFSGAWGGYFQGGGSFGRIDGSASGPGFRVNNQTATGGIDYRFSKALVTGFLFNYTGSETRFGAQTGRLGADTYRFMPFASITPFDNAYIDVMAGYSYHSYAATRSGIRTDAEADYSADQAMASVNLGYTYPIGELEITGFAGGSYIGTEVGGYGERGRGTLLTVSNYRVNSWTSTLGSQLTYAVSTAIGVFQPQVRLEWVHEFDNQISDINIRVNSLGQLALPIAANKPVTDWGNLSAGVQAIFAEGVTGFANYQGQVFSGGENHTVEGGVRFEF